MLDALARVFVAPQAAARAQPLAALAAPAAAVCGPGSVPLACALGLLLARRGPALVCVWGAHGAAAAVVPTGAARRLKASLEARGLAAQASGRLVVVSLSDDPIVAAAEAGRAAAAAGGAPVLTALSGARDPAFDALLGAQDLAVVALDEGPEELGRLALSALEGACGRAVAAARLPALSASAARAGVVATPAARRTLAAALEVLR
jgi:hypothetical protein